MDKPTAHARHSPRGEVIGDPGGVGAVEGAGSELLAFGGQPQRLDVPPQPFGALHVLRTIARGRLARAGGHRAAGPMGMRIRGAKSEPTFMFMPDAAASLSNSSRHRRSRDTRRSN